ncbi:MAG: DUF4129 domain-containing protein, partial [Nitrososphaerales archaeon]
NVAATNGAFFKFGNFDQSQNNVIPAMRNETLYTFTINDTNLFNQPNNTFPFPTIPANFLIVLIVLLFGIVAAGLWRNFRGQRTISAFDLSEETKTKRAEIAAVLGDSLSQLEQGGDYRGIILDCYRKISQIIEIKAAFDGGPATPREFKQIAAERLQLKSRYLSEVTVLFERARYSQHEITKEEADAAMDCFSKLRAELLPE